MSKKNFEDFLNKENEKSKRSVDWDAEKKWWISQIEKLYKDVQLWIDEYVKAGKIKFEVKPTTIFEEALGSYTVNEMKIQIANNIATLTPIGTILIGTKGRIDLSGKAGTIRLVLADKSSDGPKIEFHEFSSERELEEHKKKEQNKIRQKIDWTWKISSNPPKIKYTELNQDTFLECILRVING